MNWLDCLPCCKLDGGAWDVMGSIPTHGQLKMKYLKHLLYSACVISFQISQC